MVFLWALLRDIFASRATLVVEFDFELPLSAVSPGQLGIWVEPMDKSVFGDHFPQKLMGNPTVDVHFLLKTE